VSVVKNRRDSAARSSDLVRPWRGIGPEQRVAERRERLLDAALEVFATGTFHGSTVRDVCQEAGLTERYFYESFAGKEQLLGVLADRIVADFVTAAGPSIAQLDSDLDAGIRGAMSAVVSSLTDDPRRARILFVEVVGVSPAVEDKRRAVIGSLVAVIRGAAEQAFGPWVRDSVEVELIARSVIGAASELLISYVRHELQLDQDALVLNLTRLFQRVRPIFVAIAAEQARQTASTEPARQTTSNDITRRQL
jgi:AcrR family transcriptional regulator